MYQVSRWICHWQALPTRNRIGSAICVVVLLACIIAFGMQINGLVADMRQALPKKTETVQPIQAVQTTPWQKAQPLLMQADRQADETLNKHLSSIHAFLNERKVGSKGFAEQMLSLQGKWNLVRSGIGDSSTYAVFLQQTFNKYLFRMEELEKTINAAIRGYLAELEGIDDELLVRLRADLADDELPRSANPALRSDEAMRRYYHELSQRVAKDLHTDLAVIAGRELFLWEATNIATDLTLQAGAAVAARLGVSSTILTAGAASTWETLGIGLVVAIVLDAAVNRLIKAAGYDAEARIAERINQTLNALGRTITDGDPEARATVTKLVDMQRYDPQPEVRAACADSIRSIEAGTQLYGLRRELSKIGTARATLRKETVRRLTQESE